MPFVTIKAMILTFGLALALAAQAPGVSLTGSPEMPTQLPKLPVVNIAIRDGCVSLDTFHYELYDYLEDYFVEKCDLDPQPVHLTSESPPRYSLVLPSNVSSEAAVDAIAKLLAIDPEPTFECDLAAIRP